MITYQPTFKKNKVYCAKKFIDSGYYYSKLVKHLYIPTNKKTFNFRIHSLFIAIFIKGNVMYMYENEYKELTLNEPS